MSRFKFLGLSLVLALLLSAPAHAQTEQALREQAAAAMAAKNWPQAAEAYRKLVALAPDAKNYRGLGDAEANRGQPQAAIDAYMAGYKVVRDDEATEGAILLGMGNAYLKLGRKGEAWAAYTRATGLAPTRAVAYFNLCALQYNMGETKPALESCNKAIEADPNKADAYLIKGTLLFSEAKTGANNKIIVPAGTVEALQKYLALAPNGPHAAEAREMIAATK